MSSGVVWVILKWFGVVWGVSNVPKCDAVISRLSRSSSLADFDWNYSNYGVTMGDVVCYTTPPY